MVIANRNLLLYYILYFSESLYITEKEIPHGGTQ